MTESTDSPQTILCDFSVPKQINPERVYSVEEASEQIDRLSEAFLCIYQLQLQIQQNFRTIKRKDIDFTLPISKNQLCLDSIELDEESFDAISSLKLFLREVQSQIDTIVGTGCSIENLEKGMVQWQGRAQNDNDVLLTWQFGKKSIAMVEKPITKAVSEPEPSPCD